jgi:UDP-N-acetylmuramoyl-tripeptide--D-alanyl-D-alanine ligase
LRVINLECVIATCGEQGVEKGEGGPYYYRARPEMLRVLVAAGVDIVATANNHSGDYGPEALLEQGRWLDAIGIGHAGSGSDLDAALTPAIRRAGDLNVALFALDATQKRFAAAEDRPGSAYLPPGQPQEWRDIMTSRIAAARDRAHVVLVAVHWGLNLAERPSAEQTAVGHALIEAGADAVLGSSAHVLQGIEIYRNRPILYDAGDLLFDSVRHTVGHGGVFRLELSDNGVERVVFVPVCIGFGFSRQRSGSAALAASQLFATQCAELGTVLTITQSGTGFVELTPEARPRLEYTLAPTTRYDVSALVSATNLNACCEVLRVPKDALITPIHLEPLTLLGIRIHPSTITTRQMLWVETFWRADVPVEEDLRLDIKAVPVQATTMRPWGEGMDHDPCDWLMPTTRWQPGRIYRDFYGLRPPYLRNWQNVDLRMQVGVVARGQVHGPVFLPHIVKLAIPGKDGVLPVPARAAGRAPIYHTDVPQSVRHCLPGQTWTAEQLEAVTRGTWLVKPPEGWFVRSVVRGSSHVRLVEGPVLYVASDYLTLGLHEQYGDMQKVYENNWDSHSKLRQIAPGLAGAIVARPVPGLPEGFPLLQVKDPIQALVELGAAARTRLTGTVVGITGSAGKTSTLAMMKAVFSPLTSVHSTYDNYNSRVGVLAVLASAPPETELAILEVAVSAINAPGLQNIRLVGPDVAVITNIGPSHLKPGETTLDTARRKSNVFRAMKIGATAVICRDSEHFEFMAQAAHNAGLVVVSYGAHSDSDICLSSYDMRSRVVEASVLGEKFSYELAVTGRHMAINSLSCIALAHYMNLDRELLRAGFLSTAPQKGRGDILELTAGDRRIRVYDESYNANPTSMRAALEMFADTVAESGRKIIVLGDMLELGDEAPRYHEQLLPLVASCKPFQVLLVGRQMSRLRPALQHQAISCRSYDLAEAVWPDLFGMLGNGDIALLKASNSVGLHKIVACMRELAIRA